MTVSVQCQPAEEASAYSSISSRVRFPRVPISLLSSMALLNISSSSYAPLLFIVALLLVLPSDCLFLPSFLRDISEADVRGEDLVDTASGTGRYREDFGLDRIVSKFGSGKVRIDHLCVLYTM